MRNILGMSTLEALRALNNELDMLKQLRDCCHKGDVSFDSLERRTDDIERYVGGYFHVYFNEQEEQYCLVPIVR